MVVKGVRDLSGLAVGMAVYGVGIPDRTFITSLAPSGPGTVRISNGPSATGVESLQFTTVNEAKCASGGSRPTGCTQGLNFEIRFVLPPPAGNDHVLIAYNDPYGLAGIKLTSGASDNNFVPIIASGYPVLFDDQSGSGNNRWAPDYIEITHECAVIGARVTGDRLKDSDELVGLVQRRGGGHERMPAFGRGHHRSHGDRAHRRIQREPRSSRLPSTRAMGSPSLSHATPGSRC